MYHLLGLCLALAALLCANVLATLFCTALWRSLSRTAAAGGGQRPAAQAAQTLLCLRLLPFACAALFACAFIIPAYLLHEPHPTNEVVSFKLALFAVCCLAGLALAVWRGLSSFVATRRLSADWLRHSEPIELASVRVPIHRVRHRFPVIAVVGILRPRLFIAEHLFAELSAEELRAAIMHEEGHLAAYDNLKRALLRACRDVLLFVPFGRTLDRAWAEQTEAAADEHAARAGGAALALDLASALVKIARLVPAGATPSMPAGAFLVGDNSSSSSSSGGGDGIARRVRRLTQLATDESSPPPPQQQSASNGVLNYALAGALLAVLLVSATASVSQPHFLAPLHGALEHVVSALR